METGMETNRIQWVARTILAICTGVLLGIALGRELAVYSAKLVWLMPLVGALTAYVVVDIGGVLRAIPKAWKMASNPFSKFFGRARTEEGKQFFFWNTILSLAISTSMFLLLLPVSLAFPDSLDFLSGVACVCMGFGVFFFFVGADTFREGNNLKSSIMKKMAISTSPPFFFLTIFRFLFLAALPACVRFVGFLFKEVHSNIRLICLVDTAIFTAAGLILGGPIWAWMIGGAAFGVINYLVVSVVILRLQPIPVRKD
jgi:hypothetical protein